MPKVVGVVERTSRVWWGGYRCDWRAGGTGCAHPVCSVMSLIEHGHDDPRLGNLGEFAMYRLAGSGTGLIQSVGLRLSFNDPKLYEEGCRDVLLAVELDGARLIEILASVLSAGGSLGHQLPLQEFFALGDSSTGWARFLTGLKPVPVRPGSAFRVLLEVGETLRMLLSEGEELGQLGWYAEVTVFLVGEFQRLTTAR